MARPHLFGAVRHPREPKVLVLRTDRAWRLPHALAPEPVEAGNAKRVLSALERRLRTPLWLLRRLHREESEARTAASTYELELLDDGWQRPAHGRWVGRPSCRACGCTTRSTALS